MRDSFWESKKYHNQRVLESIYKADTGNSVNIDNGCFNFKWDIERAISHMSKSKTEGWDIISGEVLKLDKTHPLIEKLKNKFEEWIQVGKIPDHLMKARLILISKENTDHPTIIDTRSISIVPVVTKFI